jgi:hypothetical protein
MAGECLDVDAESFSADTPPDVVSFGGEWKAAWFIVAVVGAGIAPSEIE